jgi:cyclopropane fatty-acyl-phospholipid synthase-like methyltransferase
VEGRAVKKDVNLYDSHYSRVEEEVYRAVRLEAYGEDLGQTSWTTAKEVDEFGRWLGLTQGQRVLEVACGSGGVSVRLAENFGVSVSGVDVNPSAVAAATERARARGAQDRVEFRAADADERLPFPDASFDAVFCNDAANHFRDRKHVLTEWHRVLRAGGKCLYTDPIVVTGCVSSAEIAARSSIGFYVFMPPGVNEALLRAAGFRVRLTADVTENSVLTSRRWREARSAHRDALLRLEGEAQFDGIQRFLETVHTLVSERRLSRFAFMGEKAEPGA